MAKRNMIIGVVVVLALLAASLAYTGLFTENGPSTTGDIQTFQSVEGDVCVQDGKPVIRLFSTEWCPHCEWVGDTYDSVVKEYVDEGKIVAYHWQLDTGDDTITPGVETQVPESEMAVYKQFNEKGSIPTFIFGCKYYRIGNGYEQQGDLGLEEQEFRAVIEKLIAPS